MQACSDPPIVYRRGNACLTPVDTNNTFFRENCARSTSASDLFTPKQAKAFISDASPLLMNFNGLAAIASTVQGNDLVPLNFPLHTRTHWIDAKTGRVRSSSRSSSTRF